MPACLHCGREFEHREGEPRLCLGCAQQFLAPEPAPQPQPRTTVEEHFRKSPTNVLIAINVIVYLAMVVASRRFLDFDGEMLLHWGANAGAITTDNEWWRLFTSMFLHGGLLHVALNMWALFNLGWLAELLFGRRRFTVLYLLCGIGGSIGSIVWRGNGISVGASGAIFGVAGALIPALMLHPNERLRALLKGQLTSIALFVAYNLAFGAAARQVDNAAHIGGLVTGLFLGAVFPTARDMSVVRARTRVWIGVIVCVIAFTAACLFAQHRNAAYIEENRASDAHQKRDLSAAITHAKRAVQLNPNEVHAQFLLGSLYLETRQYADAEDAFQAAVKLSPKFGPAYINLCIAQREQKQYADALGNCEKGAQLAPNDSDSWINLGRIRYALHDSPGALAALAKAVELNPSGFDENLLYGSMLFAEGQDAKSVPYLQKAANMHPDDDYVKGMLNEAEKSVQ